MFLLLLERHLLEELRVEDATTGGVLVMIVGMVMMTLLPSEEEIRLHAQGRVELGGAGIEIVEIVGVVCEKRKRLRMLRRLLLQLLLRTQRQRQQSTRRRRG